MDLFVWEPDGAPVGAVLLVQEIFGVGSYIRDVGQRLAEAGWLVGAPDVFWRFSPRWAAEHDEAGLEASLAKVGQLDFPQAITDCVAALDALASRRAGSKAPAVVGFCMGGTLAFGVAMAGEPSACVSYYGSGVPDLIGGIDQVRCPTLFHFGDEDAYIPESGVDRVRAAIADRPGFELNVEHAGHAFDNHRGSMFYDEAAAKAAWGKTMRFLDEHAR